MMTSIVKASSRMLSLARRRGSYTVHGGNAHRFRLAASVLRTTSTQYSLFSSKANHSDHLPDHANVVIVGGGIIGTSVAYHLGKLGVQDVVLLEQDRLTSGTTWHAAGLMTTFGSLSSTSMDMRMYTRELYATILPEETGLETGFMDVGFIELACDPDRLDYFRRVAAFNRLCGIHVEEISATEVKEKFPLTNTEGILAGFYVPGDGRVNPTDATMALAKGARQRGVKLLEGVTVQGVTTTNPTETGKPRTAMGVTVQDPKNPDATKEISANIVVNCAGMWARQFGELSGVTIPNQAAEHYYLITEDIPGLDPRWPVIEDPSKCIYIRPEGKGLLVGFFEWEGAPWKPSEIPADFSFGQLEPDWDRMGPYLETAMERLVPEVHNIGIKTFFCGPESFTPDNMPIVGPAPELQNYYVAAGMNSVGILTGGGIGKTLAKWIHNNGIPPSDVDVTGIHIDRFHKYQANQEYREHRVTEALGNTYRLLYPDHQPKTCRAAKTSALHDRLVQQNAYFKDVSGWEVPGWYAPPGVTPVVENETFGRSHWFPQWEAEHQACRENVALFDMSFMSKFLVQGYDAGKFLNRLSTANVDGPSNQISYTQWLNEDGYLETDLTVTKLSDDQFLVVATDTMHNHVHAHMAQRLSRDWHVTVTDVTAKYAQINLQGPRSRELLQKLTTRDMTQNFDFRTAEEIDVGIARALCMRITYVGELGYELFIPAEQATYVYDRILEVGQEFDLKHAGLKALGSLRMEKGYRDYGHDIDNTDTIVEAGLSFTCDFKKEGGFIGMEHVRAQKDQAKEMGGLSRRMANVLVPLGPTDPLLYHGEVLWRNGDRISDIRSASYGHTVGGGVGLTMLASSSSEPVNKSYIESGAWELEIADKRYACQVSLAPFYDPKNARIKV
jgi:heterotetrameric sarcosine oxidase gamma subunit